MGYGGWQALEEVPVKAFYPWIAFVYFSVYYGLSANISALNMALFV